MRPKSIDEDDFMARATAPGTVKAAAPKKAKAVAPENTAGVGKQPVG
jgi:hypothetical protein